MKTNRTRMMVAVSGLVLGIGAAVAAQAPAVTRTQLNKMDMTWMNHEALTARADIPMGGGTGKHTHAGDEVTYVAEGMVTLEIAGMASRTVKAGEAFFVPAGTVHNVSASGGKAVAIANYLVEKGKPLATPAQ